MRPAWFRIDRSKPGPIVSPACNGTVTRPPRTGCLSWACDPFWVTTTQASLDSALTNSRPVTRGIDGMALTVGSRSDSNGSNDRATSLATDVLDIRDLRGNECTICTAVASDACVIWSGERRPGSPAGPCTVCQRADGGDPQRVLAASAAAAPFEARNGRSAPGRARVMLSLRVGATAGRERGLRRRARASGRGDLGLASGGVDRLGGDGHAAAGTRCRAAVTASLWPATTSPAHRQHTGRWDGDIRRPGVQVQAAPNAPPTLDGNGEEATS